MCNTASRKMVEGISRNLAALDCDVVSSGGFGIDTETAEHVDNQPCVAGENFSNVVAGSDEGEHEILTIGKHGTTPASTAYDIYAIGAAVCEVYFFVDLLVSSADHSRIYLPGKEIISPGQIPGSPFLHCKEERQPSGSMIEALWKGQVYHINDRGGMYSPLSVQI